jgi:hypothetical protein
MIKRCISLLLIICLVLLTAAPALGAGSFSNFFKIRTYQSNFTDVQESAWYFDGVRDAYEYGLIDGRDSERFDPGGTLTLAESIKLAAVLHKGFFTGSIDFVQGSPWYAVYVDYLRSSGITVSAFRNLNVPATRSDFALLIAAALPDEALTPINRISDGAIPDVFESYSYGQAVYKLYRAGVLTGSGEAGTFFPGRTITRAEAATILMRVVEADTRVSLSLAVELTGEQIYAKASPAVFFIEVFNDEEERIKTGSGFFICESGIAITNYHVIIGGDSAKVTLSDGEVMDVLGIYDYCWRNDAVIIQVEGESFPYLEMADSAKLLTGATVYALGSPLGLQASFSRGIVSQALREIEGSRYIQLDAAISYGSSGGALIDTMGRVVGVTSASMTNSQNINLAIPINAFEDMDRTSYVSFSDIYIPATYYIGLYPVPDFGAFFDVEPFDVDYSRGRLSHAYLVSDLPRDVSSVLDDYEHLIAQRLFIHFSNTTLDDSTFKNFYNNEHQLTISLGRVVMNEQDCILVTVY